MRGLTTVGLAVLLSACVAGAGRVGTASQEVSDQVKAATAAWADAYNSRQPDRITALYAPDAVLLGHDLAPVLPDTGYSQCSERCCA